MIILKEEISSQENMEAWLSQLGHPDNPISNKGLLEHLKPRFVSVKKMERPLTLTEVFPKIFAERDGINVKA